MANMVSQTRLPSVRWWSSSVTTDTSLWLSTTRNWTSSSCTPSPATSRYEHCTPLSPAPPFSLPVCRCCWPPHNPHTSSKTVWSMNTALVACESAKAAGCSGHKILLCLFATAAHSINNCTHPQCRKAIQAFIPFSPHYPSPSSSPRVSRHLHGNNSVTGTT